MAVSENILNELTLKLRDKERLLSLAYREMQGAAEYVSCLLPKPLRSGDISTDWLYMPSSSIGGDSFGYRFIDEENFAFYLLDVCGHGVKSALHSVTILNTINNISLGGADFRKPGEVLHQLNNRFRMQDFNELFFSMFYFVYNIKSHELKYCGAGHPPAVLIGKGNEPILLKSRNKILGFLPDIEFKEDCLRLDCPTDCYIYTDGGYEFNNSNNNPGSFEDIIESIKVNRKMPVAELQYIYMDSLARNCDQALKDDFTMLKVRLQLPLSV